MKAGDSLKVNTSGAATAQYTSPKAISFVKKDSLLYTETYYPHLLATDVEKTPFSIANNFLSGFSFLPKNEKLDVNGEIFRFFKYQGESHRLLVESQNLTAENTSVAVADSSLKVDGSPTADSLKAALPAKTAVDSLPPHSFNSTKFDIAQLHTSLLDRFELQEYVSRDSYILLESHPELVFGPSSRSAHHGFSVQEVGVPRVRQTQDLGFVNFSMLIIGLLFFIFSLKYQSKNIVEIFKSLLSMHEASNLFSSRSIGLRRFGLVSSFFYILTVAIFVLLVAQKLENDVIPTYGIIASYLLIFVGFGILFVLKNLLWKILGNISRNNNLFEEIRFSHQLYFTSFALLIFPLQIVASYSAKPMSLTFIYISIALIIILLIQYFIRTLRLFLRFRVSFFFWFLYFCTLEILPIVLALYVVGVIGS